MRVLLAVLLLAMPGHGSVLRDLDETQRDGLRKGELIVRAEEVSGGAWPRLTVYVRVNAPVSAVENVFRDYASAPRYTPGLVSADVLRRPDPDTYEVCYVNQMPIIGESRSTVLNRYSRDGESLVVRWKLLHATHAEESTGELRAEPDGPDTCILRYTNYVRPKSSLARLAKSAAVGEVRKTVLAIKKESERRRG